MKRVADIMQAWFEADGYLAVSTERFASGAAWDGARVLPHCPALARVGQHFPHLVPVTHLALRTSMPRLPADQEYLTRIPLSDAPGEMGLRAGTHVPALRTTHGGDGGWTEQPGWASDWAVPGRQRLVKGRYPTCTGPTESEAPFPDPEPDFLVFA